MSGWTKVQKTQTERAISYTVVSNNYLCPATQPYQIQIKHRLQVHRHV